ncbi:MAG: peptidylprolyl isomerase [Propionibacteriaceae bacterium]|nr:peptidylprolyl isomerase [Propionibacteriaceae bacterium]
MPGRRLLAPALLLAALALAACSTPPGTANEGGQPTDVPVTGTTTCVYNSTGSAARPAELPPTENVPASGTTPMTITLNGQAFTLTLDRAAAPCTANSFESLALQGYFDQTACHRLTDAGGLYVLQCGDPSGTGAGGPGYNFPDELEATSGYPAGTVAMANSGPNTNGSQFFIVYEDSQLPNSYTVFGQLDEEGLEFVRQIALGGQDGSFGASGGGAPLIKVQIDSITAG